MFPKLKRLISRHTCRHVYGWSERRQLEVCYYCGDEREGSEPVLPPLAANEGGSPSPPAD